MEAVEACDPREVLRRRAHIKPSAAVGLAVVEVHATGALHGSDDKGVIGLGVPRGAEVREPAPWGVGVGLVFAYTSAGRRFFVLGCGVAWSPARMWFVGGARAPCVRCRQGEVVGCVGAFPTPPTYPSGCHAVS